jgi:hypothetical protein
MEKENSIILEKKNQIQITKERVDGMEKKGGGRRSKSISQRVARL